MSEQSIVTLEEPQSENCTQMLSFGSVHVSSAAPGAAFSPKIQALLKVISDFVFVVGRDGTILQFQSCRHSEFRVPPETLVGKKVADLLPEEIASQALDHLEAAFRTGATQSFGCHHLLPGGFSEFEIRISVWDENEAVAMVRDVTERRMLQKELLEISQRERTRIGQDIHDGLGQYLTGISFLSRALHNKLKALGMPEAEEAAEIGRQVVQTLAQTRTLARGLFPIEIEVHGLTAALTELAATAEERFDISCPLHVDPSIQITDDANATHLFRLAQEAISNSVKHGRAATVTVSLQRLGEHGEIVLSIVDDGEGFTLPDESRKGLGLRIMNYRAQKVGGVLEVGPAPGRGTQVRCTFKNQHETALRQCSASDIL